MRSILPLLLFGITFGGIESVSAQSIENCVDPDASIPENRRMLEQGEPCNKYKVAPKRYFMKPAFYRPVSPSVRSRIMANYSRVAIDPASTIWRWLPQTHPDYICVWVNSKNRMGGYAGWHISLFRIEKDGTIESGVALKDQSQIRGSLLDHSVCEQLGHDPALPPAG